MKERIKKLVDINLAVLPLITVLSLIFMLFINNSIRSISLIEKTISDKSVVEKLSKDQKSVLLRISHLENVVNTINEKEAVRIFFEKNKDYYYQPGINNISYRLGYCCVGLVKNSTDLFEFGYDFLIEYESGKVDDGATNSLLKIGEFDQIKSFEVKEIKIQNETYPAVYVILNTNNSHLETLLLPLEQGDYMYYYRPFDLREDDLRKYVRGIVVSSEKTTFILDKKDVTNKIVSSTEYTVNKITENNLPSYKTITKTIE